MTIYALSTAPGRAGIAVIRISGEAVSKTLHLLCQGKMPAPRFASLRSLNHPVTHDIIDRGLVLWFPRPASFTGEDVAELHLHGGRAVVSAAFDALSSLGLRMAEPGEFTRRAFENGKLDLTEAEGLADLINADTPAQRRQAIAQAGGSLRGRYEAWRASLLRAMAYVEASLDFADEGDIAEGAFGEAFPEVRSLAVELDRALADERRGEILREGIQVAIIGAPNVGKSSLLNALAGREAAIVFDEPGTTRDIIEVAFDLDGFPFVLRDTAGLRETGSAVEREGIRRALATAEAADLVLCIYDATKVTGSAISEIPNALLPNAKEDGNLARFQAGDESGGTGTSNGQRATVEASRSESGKIIVLNKIDLAPGLPPAKLDRGELPVMRVSAKTGEGLDVLKASLTSFARDTYGCSETPLITRARHRQEIERARKALQWFLENADARNQPELSAEHLREAADALGRLTGRLDVEDVLGAIFSEFCIGK
jgi:tRNA modification GTPase